MNLYKSDNWEVVFGSWCQEFVGYCIISSKKENLSELTSDDWVELGMLEKELERVCKKVFNYPFNSNTIFKACSIAWKRTDSRSPSNRNCRLIQHESSQ